jgi:hypothetical protein
LGVRNSPWQARERLTVRSIATLTSIAAPVSSGTGRIPAYHQQGGHGKRFRATSRTLRHARRSTTGVPPKIGTATPPHVQSAAGSASTATSIPCLRRFSTKASPVTGLTHPPAYNDKRVQSYRCCNSVGSWDVYGKFWLVIADKTVYDFIQGQKQAYVDCFGIGIIPASTIAGKVDCGQDILGSLAIGLPNPPFGGKSKVLATGTVTQHITWDCCSLTKMET